MYLEVISKKDSIVYTFFLSDIEFIMIQFYQNTNDERIKYTNLLLNKLLM